MIPPQPLGQTAAAAAVFAATKPAVAQYDVGVQPTLQTRMATPSAGGMPQVTAQDQPAPLAHMTGPSPGGAQRVQCVVEQGQPVIFDRIMADGGVAAPKYRGSIEPIIVEEASETGQQPPRSFTEFSQVPQQITNSSMIPSVSEANGTPERNVLVHVPAGVYEAMDAHSAAVAKPMPQAATTSLPYSTMTKPSDLASIPVPQDQPNLLQRTRAPPMGAAEGLLPAPPVQSAPVYSEVEKEKQWSFFDSTWEGLNDSLPQNYVRVHLFTMGFSALFCAPVAIALILLKDATVQYWVGQVGLLAVCVPVLVLVGYALHVRAGRLSLLAMLIGSVFPAVLLLVIGQMHVSGTGSTVSRLLISKDCTTYAPKDLVQKAWGMADRTYDQCMADHQKKLEARNERLAAHSQGQLDKKHKLLSLDLLRFSLEDCDKYILARECSSWWPSRPQHCEGSLGQNVAEYYKEWLYLQRMEEELSCSGWCSFSRPLWTLDQTQDSCSAVSAAVMDQKVRPLAWTLMMFSFFILIGSIVCIALTGFELSLSRHTVSHLMRGPPLMVKK